jgi:hypothetical protein
VKKWLSFAAAFALLALSGTAPSVAQDEARFSASINGLYNVEITEGGQDTENFSQATYKKVYHYASFNTSLNDDFKNKVIIASIIDDDGPDGPLKAGLDSFCKGMFRDCANDTRSDVANLWAITFIDGGMGCQAQLDLAMLIARRLGYEVLGPGYTTCWGGVTGQQAMGQLILAPKKAAIAGQCTAKSYAGAWSRPGTGAQRAQVRLQFDDPSATKQPMGRVSGFNASPYGEGEVVVSQIQASKTCEFSAQCTSPLGSANPCTLNIDPAKGTLKIVGGSKVFVSNVVWTRAAAAPKEKECGNADIEGNWTRTDGAQISVAGGRFKDGGNALLYNHPTGGWPQGAFKFSQIKSKGTCDWEAQCATVYRDSAKGGFNTVRGACTLTVDPETKTMTASGTHGTFKR